MMYVSRLIFHANSGQTNEVEQELHRLMVMVKEVGGVRPRILRNPFASSAAADVVFEQEAPDLDMLETQIHQVTEKGDFQKWSDHMSGLLAQSPKREIYLVVE